MWKSSFLFSHLPAICISLLISFILSLTIKSIQELMSSQRGERTLNEPDSWDERKKKTGHRYSA